MSLSLQTWFRVRTSPAHPKPKPHPGLGSGEREGFGLAARSRPKPPERLEAPSVSRQLIRGALFDVD